MIRTPSPTALDTYKLVVAGSPLVKGVLIQSVYGTEVFVLAFEALTEPANGSVPIMAPIHVAVNARNVRTDFPEDGVQIRSPGLLLVASSTDETLTVVTAAKLDITAFIEEYDITPVPSGSTTVGDLTTDVASLEIWNDAAGPKKLYRVNIINGVAAARYAVVYAEDVPDANSKIVTWMKLAASETKEFHFGEGGFEPHQLDLDGTVHNACVIAAQEDLVPGNISAGTDFNIQAFYK